MDEYKKMAERLEHKVNKNEKEITQSSDHIRNYEAKLMQ
jgi:hypothetical protein